MKSWKPRTKRQRLKELAGFNVSLPVKKILAEVAVEIEGAAFEAVRDLRAQTLGALLGAARELKMHAEEYHHETDPEVLKALTHAVRILTGKKKWK